ncbi:Crp/Fnr family transcriptional regulator [Chthonobacter albigriseus]|uniref:Crp/Fnr family transcriptional regulator n=1 Tax=Chthonobacter albigriseus TaxID=1683161 RepID=UPI0015EE923F|nr:Crp/Fnr family transcriptional regulator [Chthonobacter albigriseus]
MTDASERTLKGTGNFLLDVLAPGDLGLIAPFLQRVDLRQGQTLFEAGDEVNTIHFPCGQTIGALLVVMRNGDVAESATIGREGAIGGIVSQGNLPAFSRAVVQIAGPAYRIEAARLQAAKQQSIAIRNLMARYADCILAQIVQSVACNALHPIDARCARWILTIQDRIGNDHLPVTHQFLAEALGVQRTYLSRVLGILQKRGLVRSRRGTVEVLSRNALEEVSCECYACVRLHYDKVLIGVYGEQNPTNGARAKLKA